MVCGGFFFGLLCAFFFSGLILMGCNELLVVVSSLWFWWSSGMSFSWIWMWVKLIRWVPIGLGWVVVAGLLLLVGRVVIFFF